MHGFPGNRSTKGSWSEQVWLLEQEEDSASFLDPAVTKSKGQQETKAGLTRTLMVLGTAS